MKNAILFISFLLISLGASAQENISSKPFESVVQLGGGLFLETGTDHRIEEQNPGAMLRLSYGLDIRLSKKLSVMPGVGIRAQHGDIMHWRDYGGDCDALVFADVFLSGRYHLDAGRQGVIIGLGPAFSYMVSPVYYDVSNAKLEKFSRYDIGIQPSVTFLTSTHFQWGLEANIGLLDLRKRYPFINTPFGSTYLHYLAVTCGWHF